MKDRAFEFPQDIQVLQPPNEIAAQSVARAKKRTVSIEGRKGGEIYKILNKYSIAVVGDDVYGQRVYDVQFPHVSAGSPEKVLIANDKAARIWKKGLREAIYHGLLTEEKAEKIARDSRYTVTFQDIREIFALDRSGREEGIGNRNVGIIATGISPVMQEVETVRARATHPKSIRLLVVSSTAMMALSACVVPEVRPTATKVVPTEVKELPTPIFTPEPEPTATPFSALVGSEYPTSDAGFLIGAGGSENAEERIRELGAGPDIERMRAMYLAEVNRAGIDLESVDWVFAINERAENPSWTMIPQERTSGRFLWPKLTAGSEAGQLVRAGNLFAYLDREIGDDFFDFVPVQNPEGLGEVEQRLVSDESGWFVAGFFSPEGKILAWFNADRNERVITGEIIPRELRSLVSDFREQGFDIFPGVGEEGNVGLFIQDGENKRKLGDIDIEDGTISLVTEKNEPIDISSDRLEIIDGKIVIVMNEGEDKVLEFVDGRWVSDKLLYLAAGKGYYTYDGEYVQRWKDYPRDIEGSALPTGIDGEPTREGEYNTQNLTAVLIGVIGEDPNYPKTAIRAFIGFYDIQGVLHTYEMMVGNDEEEVVGFCSASSERVVCWLPNIREAEEMIVDWLKTSKSYQFHFAATIYDNSDIQTGLTSDINRFADVHRELIEAIKTGDNFPEPSEGYFIRSHMITFSEQ